MKKVFKSRIFAFVLGALIFSGITGVAAYTILANDIGYTPKDTTWKKSNGEDITNVKDAIDELYTKANGNSYCKKINGNKTTIGSEYVCDPGDGIYRIFYVLEVKDDDIDLIMDRNINKGTMNWSTAYNYFLSGDGVTLKRSWTNVEDVNIPKAEVIAKAVGNTSWDVTTAPASSWFYFDKYSGNYQNSTQVASASNRSAYGWLYEHTRECESYGCPLNTSLDTLSAYGYWLQEKISNDSSFAWSVFRNGILDYGTASKTDYYGVRPVITVLKSQLN